MYQNVSEDLKISGTTGVNLVPRNPKWRSKMMMMKMMKINRIVDQVQYLELRTY